MKSINSDPIGSDIETNSNKTLSSHNFTECHWQSIDKPDATMLFKGNTRFAEQSFNVLQSIGDVEELAFKIEELLKSLEEFSSGVIETDFYVMGWVDHIRSWPLFYAQQAESFFISNNARNLSEKLPVKTKDEKSCLEFAMSGYVAGARTLYREIACLQPGEFFIWDKRAANLTVKSYYQYIPDMTDNTVSRTDNIVKLGDILDLLTKKIIERAGDRPIWIPLSGGMDSRIILCKLHEHGCKNIHTFTYGPRLNFEARIAKKIANKLGVPWHFISPTKKQIRQYFNSEERKKFWSNTDGLKAMSCMREFSAIMYLREGNIMPDNAIIINGQSGDYITGAHISQKWVSNNKFTKNDLFQILLNKHYDLWKTLRTSKNEDDIKQRIASILSSDYEEAQNGIEWATLEEIWEYRARQICLVVNGQRIYDFLGYDWEMPLWEKTLVDFCEKLPLNQKINQNLYIEYLKKYNYRGLFPRKEPYIWRWPIPMLWVVPMAQIIGLLRGRVKKDNFYALMRYYGHYSNQFYSYPWSLHYRTHSNARNVVSLNVRQWVIENPDIFKEDIKKALFI